MVKRITFSHEKTKGFLLKQGSFILLWIYFVYQGFSTYHTSALHCARSKTINDRSLRVLIYKQPDIETQIFWAHFLFCCLAPNTAAQWAFEFSEIRNSSEKYVPVPPVAQYFWTTFKINWLFSSNISKIWVRLFPYYQNKRVKSFGNGQKWSDFSHIWCEQIFW